MIYDEPTIDFIMGEIEKKRKELSYFGDDDDDYEDGKYVAYSKVMIMLHNMKKIKAIN